MISTNGQLKGFQVIVSSPSRGQVQTFIRFDLERGTEYWLMLWHDEKIRGWSINVSAPTATPFLATSPNEFASLDVPTGKVTRIRFHEKEGELLIQAASGSAVLARKVK